METRDEEVQATRDLKNNKGAGDDGITSEIIKMTDNMTQITDQI